MDNREYQGSATTGGKWGCALAAIIGIPLIGLSIAFEALGDCVPDAPCNHGLIWWLVIPAILTTLIVGFGSRAAINWFLKRRDKDN